MKYHRVIKSGSTAKVYLYPRLPCQDENEITKEMKRQIAKISTNSSGRESSEAEYNRAIKIFGKDLSNASKYFVLPLKLCVINPNLTTSDKFDLIRKSVEYDKKQMNEYTSKNKQMVVYEKMDITLEDMLKDIKSIEEIIVILKSLENVYNAILYLKLKSPKGGKTIYTHSDIKLNNIMKKANDNTLKLIDLGSLNLNPITKDYYNLLRILVGRVFLPFCLSSESKFKYDDRFDGLRELLLSYSFIKPDNTHNLSHDTLSQEDYEIKLANIFNEIRKIPSSDHSSSNKRTPPKGGTRRKMTQRRHRNRRRH